MRSRAGRGYDPFLNVGLYAPGNYHRGRLRLLREVVGQILGDHSDLILRQGSTDIDHHVDNVLPSLLGISGAGHLVEVVALNAKSLDRFLAIAFGQSALTAGGKD